MNILLAVAEDLWHFVWHEWFGLRLLRPAIPMSVSAKVPSIPDLTQMQRQNEIYQSVAEDGVETVLYVCVPSTKLYAFPTVTFDGVFQELTYGTAIASVANVGRFVEVVYGDTAGWILRDDLQKDVAAVYPQLQSNVLYTAQHADTQKLRAVIQDAFLGAELQTTLSDIEYVSFKLMRKGKRITWPLERPRISGSWQRLLKGAPGVHMAITPKADAVMETVAENGIGHVAYVEAVFPDGSILVSEVGFEEEGHYSERTLPKDVWKELRPVFIETT